jgi:hypothetical protein
MDQPAQWVSMLRRAFPSNRVSLGILLSGSDASMIVAPISVSIRARHTAYSGARRLPLCAAADRDRLCPREHAGGRHPGRSLFRAEGTGHAEGPLRHDTHVDTIYANAFIDLSQGPAMLTLPALGECYGAVSLMSMFSDNFAVIGSRTTGQDGGTLTLVGPNDPAPAGAVHSPTPWVWVLARIVANRSDDVPAAFAILHGIACGAAAEAWRRPTSSAPSTRCPIRLKIPCAEAGRDLRSNPIYASGHVLGSGHRNLVDQT